MKKDKDMLEVEGMDTVRNDELEQEILTKRMINKKNKSKIIVVGILLVGAIAIGLFVGWNKINANPLTVYKNAINDVYSKLSKSLDKIDDNKAMGLDLLSESVVVKADTTLTSNIPALEKFSGVNYNLDLGLNLKEEKMNFGLGVNEKNKKIVNFLMSLVDKKAYVECLEVFDKVVLLGDFDFKEELKFDEVMEQVTSKVTFDKKSIDYILKKSKNYLIESLDDKKLSMMNDKISVRDKEMRVKKVIYTIDEECALNTSKYMINHIVKDNKFISSLSNISGYKESEIREKLESVLEELNNYESKDSMAEIEMVLYADKFNNVVASAFLVDNEEIMHFEMIDDLVSGAIVSSDIEVSWWEEEDDITLSFEENGIEQVSIKIYKDEEAKLEFKANVEGVLVNGALELKNVKTNKNKGSGDYNFSLEVSLLGHELNLELKGSYSMEKANFDTLKTNNSVNINEISKDEVNKIYSNFEKILERFGLKEMFSGV